MMIRDIAFYEGLPFEIYNKDPENWNRVLTKLYLINLIIVFSRDCYLIKKIELNNSIMNKLESDRRKILDHILLNSKSNIDILIQYPTGSGGNFLKNCLYFSDDISCLDVDFCEIFYNKVDINKIIVDIVNDVKVNYHEMDEFKNFVKFKKINTLEEKLNYVISKTKSQVTWIDPTLKADLNIDQVPRYNIDCIHIPINKTIKELWPDCKTIISFKNHKLFNHIRRYPQWCWFRGNPENTLITKETFLQFCKRSQKCKKNIMNKLNDEIQINSHCSLSTKINFYSWDTNWYFSEKDTITHIKRLYDSLSLSGFNEDAISKYYKVWIKTMSDLKTKALNEVTK